MAALTWRNVDAPNFSGANDLWKTAATLMNSGFDRARQGLNDFNTNTTNDQSAALMQQVIAAGNDPAKIAAATAAAPSAWLSPEALRFANAQPGVLLERQQAGANITGTNLQNKGRQQALDVGAYDFGRKQTLDQRADTNYALMPEATAEMARIRTAMSSGNLTPEQQGQMQQDFLTKYGRVLGINDAAAVGSFFSNNQSAATTQQQTDITKMKNAETLQGLILNKDAKGIANNVLAQYPDIAQATRAIQGFNNLDAETKTAAIGALAGLAPAVPPRSAADTLIRGSELFPGGAAPRLNLPSTYQPIEMQNRGTRDRPLSAPLTSAFSSVLPNLGLTAVVTSGGQVDAAGAARGEGGRTGSTRHDHGDAADVKFKDSTGRILSWENPQDVLQLQRAVTELKKAGLTGFGAGSDYMGATTTHIGYGSPAVWGSKGGAPYQALLDAYNSAGNTVNNTAGPTANKAAATAAQPQYQAAMDAVSRNQPYNAPITADTAPDEKTFTTKIGDAWFNIPTTVNGQKMPEQVALDQFKKGTNPAVGVFKTQREATSAAETRANDISRMIDERTGQIVAASEQAQAASVLAPASVNPAAAPESKNGEIKINDRITIPSVNSSGSQASQDIQSAKRKSAISGALEGIKTELSVNKGGGPLAGAAGSAWDYFMADPATAQDHAAGRAGAQTALKWYQTDAARKHFESNPEALREATADPVAFYQQFQQNKPKDSPAASAKTEQSAPTPKIAPEQAQVQARTRALNNAETVDQMFSVANNTAALNQTNQQYQSITNAIQNRERSGESATETASRLTSGEGPLKNYKHSEVTTAIQKVRDELKVSPAIAGALLMETGNYSEGYLGGWLFGAGKGYDVQEMAKVKNLWDNYQRTANAAGGIAALTSSDLTKYQQTQVNTLQEQVKTAQETLKAAIADPNTPPDKVALYQQQLATLPETVRARLNTIIASGALTTNLATRPNR